MFIALYFMPLGISKPSLQGIEIENLRFLTIELVSYANICRLFKAKFIFICTRRMNPSIQIT